ncbi:MAG: endonuclease, partial [Mycobacterium sp.]|nr:endonuclease [Mycobacterium sp.]
MSVDRPFLTAEVARARVGADLDVIDEALTRLRGTSTDLVGNAFRVEVTERLETQLRVTGGLSYRMFAELADPPDGDDRPVTRLGVKVRDVLARRLRIVPAEVGRRFKVAARITARRSLTGQPLPPELPVLADAVEDGAVGEEHIKEICGAIDVLPAAVADQKGRVERTLVRHARRQDAAFVASVGRRLADTLNPDGLFDDRDRMNRRSMTLGRQGPDGMSRLSGWITPEGRA